MAQFSERPWAFPVRSYAFLSGARVGKRRDKRRRKPDIFSPGHFRPEPRSLLLTASRSVDKLGLTKTAFMGEDGKEKNSSNRSLWRKAMNYDQGRIILRKATRADVRQIAEIVVEDWKTAYRGIIDDDYLDSMSVEQQYQKEIQRYERCMVAASGQEILGFAWNEAIDDEAADCEIVALYVRCAARKSGIGRALLQNSIDIFRASGKKRMIIWCLRENDEARRFYEKMGGKADKTGTHQWGNRAYDMISYLYQLDG